MGGGAQNQVKDNSTPLVTVTECTHPHSAFQVE